MAEVTFEGAFEGKKEKHADLAAERLQPGWRAVGHLPSGRWGPRQHRNIYSAAPEDHGIQCEEGIRWKGRGGCKTGVLQLAADTCASLCVHLHVSTAHIHNPCSFPTLFLLSHTHTVVLVLRV